VEKGKKGNLEKMREPFQGIFNIVRFNWHFYVIAAIAISLLFLACYFVSPFLQSIIFTLCVLAILSVLLSLAASYYIYDVTDLYQLNWIESESKATSIVNINAGFDETSHLLQAKFNNAKLTVLDFYDPIKHTEISIKRARKAYPAYPNTKSIKTTELELADNSADIIFLIFAAHEIRDEAERIVFFKALNRLLKPDGKIYITEHLRDLPNFIAYNIGFFHFHAKSTWLNNFSAAKLKIVQEKKLNPFVSKFILSKDGVAS
jgi:SAM-dependent methyltransferase